MDDLQNILGEDLGDCLECCDDLSPTQSEADAQNRKVMHRRRLRVLKRKLQKNPALAAELGKISFGRILKAGVTGGVSELARTRVGKAIATGGMSEVARTVKKGKAAAKGVEKAAGKILGEAKHVAGKLAGEVSGEAKAALGAAASVGLPAIHINVTPCKASDAVASDVAKKVAPEMARIQNLLHKMDVQNQATSEHNRIKRRNKFRKQVIGLLQQVQEKRCHA